MCTAAKVCCLLMWWWFGGRGSYMCICVCVMHTCVCFHKYLSSFSQALLLNCSKLYTRTNACILPPQALLFNRVVDDLNTWMDEVENHLMSEDHGKDLTSVNSLLKKHQVGWLSLLFVLMSPRWSGTETSGGSIVFFCLVGLVVRTSTFGVEDPDFDSCLCRGDFLGLSHNSDLKIDTPVATLPDAWHYRFSAGTG